MGAVYDFLHDGIGMARFGGSLSDWKAHGVLVVIERNRDDAICTYNCLSGGMRHICRAVYPKGSKRSLSGL